MNDMESLRIYNQVTQEEHEQYEAMFELMANDVSIPIEEIKKGFAYFVMKTYLLENKLI